MTDMNDVLLGFCHNGSVSACFMNSLLGAFAEDARREAMGGMRRLVEYHDASGPYIQDNRARIARYFLEHTDYQWLWMLDNDIQFPPDSLYTLLSAAEEHDVKILGAAYWNQYEMSHRLLCWLSFTEHDGIKALPEIPPTTSPVEVTAVGMGCTLIHRSALQDVADSYPNDPWDTFGSDILVSFEEGGYLTGRTPEDCEPAFHGRTVKKVERMGEDVTFCIRARRVGYLTYGLPGLVVEHFKPHYMTHGRQNDDRKLVAVS